MEFKMNSFIFFGGDFGVHVSSLFNMNSPKSPAPFPRLRSSQHCRPRGAGAAGEGLSQGAHQAQPGCDACDAWWLGDDSFDFVWGLYYLLSHNIYIYYIIHSNNDNNDDHIMMVINNNNNKVIYIHMNILEIIIVLGIMLLTNQWTVEWQRCPTLSQAQAGQLAMVDHAALCSPSLLPSCWSSPSSCTGCLIPWPDE